MKEFIISANVSAETLARPTTVGSLFMHFSHATQAFSIAGTRVFGAQRFSRYSFEHTAISCNISPKSANQNFGKEGGTCRIFLHFLIDVALDCPYKGKTDI